MQYLVTHWNLLLAWFLFFLTTVYGHVGLKYAVSRDASPSPIQVLTATMNWWGISALLAWAVSAFIWAYLLTRESFFAANSVSSIRYALLCGTGVFLFGDRLNASQILGMLLIIIGVALIKGFST
jgi:drug/metabolite transporter (DMT)-like permease